VVSRTPGGPSRQLRSRYNDPSKGRTGQRIPKISPTDDHSSSSSGATMIAKKTSEEQPTKTQNKCAHPACSCAPEKGSKYCGSYCEGARDKIELSCNCGHAACMAM